MKQFAINQASFLTSVGQGQDYPAPLPCEIAVVGRSNVGKSSLINCITNNQKLAKTSQTPGKTRLINYFVLNRAFYLVDLPGYGFAKRSKTEQKCGGCGKSYRLPKGLSFYVEGLLALYFVGCFATAIHWEMWLSMPFLYLFLHGYVHIFLLGLLPRLGRWRRMEVSEALAG